MAQPVMEDATLLAKDATPSGCPDGSPQHRPREWTPNQARYVTACQGEVP